MKLIEIKVPPEFAASRPRQYKMDECRDHYARHGALDRDLIISRDGFLIDGYVGYLVLKECGVGEYPVVQSTNIYRRTSYLDYPHRETIYVTGKHPNCDREFIWRIGRKTTDVNNLSVGNHALVNTRHGPMKVLVTRIETLRCPPVPQSVKKVIKCFSD